MATDKIQAGIRFREDVLKKITVIAKANSRSLNGQVEFLVKNCIEEYEQENGEIKINKF